MRNNKVDSIGRLMLVLLTRIVRVAIMQRLLLSVVSRMLFGSSDGLEFLWSQDSLLGAFVVEGLKYKLLTYDCVRVMALLSSSRLILLPNEWNTAVIVNLCLWLLIITPRTFRIWRTRSRVLASIFRIHLRPIICTEAIYNFDMLVFIYDF